MKSLRAISNEIENVLSFRTIRRQLSTYPDLPEKVARKGALVRKNFLEKSKDFALANKNWCRTEGERKWTNILRSNETKSKFVWLSCRKKWTRWRMAEKVLRYFGWESVGPIYLKEKHCGQICISKFVGNWCYCILKNTSHYYENFSRRERERRPIWCKHGWGVGYHRMAKSPSWAQLITYTKIFSFKYKM